MDIIAIIKSCFLGIIEGLTEFIPVSSTGHLILISDILKMTTIQDKVFDIAIQFGAILAVCYIYRHKLIGTVISLHNSPSSRHFATVTILAFIPAVILGFIFHKFIKEELFSPKVVSFSMLIGGIAILIIEKFRPNPKIYTINNISYPRALMIGLFQCLAMIPGTSRSGATIMGALLISIDRKTAAEFSFFLAIPTMFAATLYDIYKNYSILTLDNLTLITIGFVSSFLVALLVVKNLISFISKHGFAPFAIYRIVLGSIMLYLLYHGGIN